MAAACRRNVFVLVLASIVISSSIASPSLLDLKRERDLAKALLLANSTTTPSPPSNELTCEEKFKNAEKFSFDETSLNTDMRRLMESYHNWGELLAPAPVAISTLGHLIIMSTQRLDFPININVPTGGFKHIKYPTSFRTTLLQISHQGYLAFLKAHTNMDKIRMYSSNTPTHIKDATRYLMTRDEFYMLNLLPLSLRQIQETADQSKQLSLEVAIEFGRVIELIRETVNAISETKNYPYGNESMKITADQRKS